MKNHILKIDPKDNIVVALKDLEQGAFIEEFQIILKENIKQKHKFSLTDLRANDPVFMYGVLVGKATKPISKGAAITTENLVHASSDYRTHQESYSWTKPNLEPFRDLTFDGYKRTDGKVGTQNYWLVIPLVFCENRNVDRIEASMNEALGYPSSRDYAVNISNLIKNYQAGHSPDEIKAAEVIIPQKEFSKNRIFPNVDGIKYLKHNGGCGGTRDDAEMLCRLLAGYIANPNVAGATILSLGCQNAQMEILQNALSTFHQDLKKPVYYVEQQESRSEEVFLDQAIKSTFLGLIEANKVTRQPAPISKMILGLECGGSDGFSGISANPVLGQVSDILVGLGGTAVLSEFPELNGVEQELINRCVSIEKAEKFTHLMSEYSKAAEAVNSGFANNPSPGNIKDGLITDAIKSAGAAKKGGTSPITDILDYAEPVVVNGLNLLCTPGNDVESTTGLAGSGCNMIVFTTGLGTPTGNPVTPVLKISSNTKLYNEMPDIIDFNTGTLISGEKSLETLAEELLYELIEIASGRKQTKAQLNFNNDFIPWKRGISL